MVAVTPWELYKPDGGLVISEAEGSRSRGWGTIASGGGKMVAGTLLAGTTTLTAVATPNEATITSVLLYSIDATNQAVEVAVLRRDCEINEGYVVWDGLVAATVITTLAALGIVVRPGALAGPGGTYGVARASDPAFTNTPYGTTGNAGIGGGFMMVEAAEGDPPPDPPAARSQGPSRTDQPPPGR
jgi:head decoration protein D